MAISNIDPELCLGSGCGECVEACLMDVIRLDGDKDLAVIKYPADCQICYLCQVYCPVEAITITPQASRPIVLAWG